MTEASVLVIYALLLIAALVVGLAAQALILNEIYRARRVHRVAAAFPQWWTVKRRGPLRRVHLVDVNEEDVPC